MWKKNTNRKIADLAANNAPARKAAAELFQIQLVGCFVIFSVVLGLLITGISTLFKVKSPAQLREERLENLLLVCEIGIESNIKDPLSFKRINSGDEQMRT